MVTIYNRQNTWDDRSKPAIVRLSGRGFIHFSVEAVKLLKLKEGMTLIFRVDDQDPNIILFHEHKSGIPLRVTAKLKKTGHVRLSILCRPLSLKLLAFLKLRQSTSIRLTAETVKAGDKQYWFISKDFIHIPTKWK